MISLVPLNVQSWYLVPIDNDALLVDLAIWRFRWSQTDVTSYRFGHYCLLVEDRSFTCTLGVVEAENLLLCVADFRCRLVVRYLLFVVVRSGGWRCLGSASSNRHLRQYCWMSAQAFFERQSRLRVSLNCTRHYSNQTGFLLIKHNNETYKSKQ